MSFLQILAVLLSLASVAAYCNYRLLGLPRTIGLMAFALVFTIPAVVFGHLGVIPAESLRTFYGSFNFSTLLLHGVLAFLLFAGALHVDLESLRSSALPVGVFATVGVILATFLTAGMLRLVSGWLGIQLSLIPALLFGALISPTDPIAVLGILRSLGVPKRLETLITGEALLNDGVGIVVFLTVLEAGHGSLGVGSVALLFLRETAGGAVLGFLLGWICYRLLRSVDAYQVEVLFTLALASGAFTLAEALGVSAPIAVVVAGLLIGNPGRTYAMSQTTRERLDEFWELVDEIANAVLFLLIGLELVVVPLKTEYLLASGLAVVIVLLSRFGSVGVLVAVLQRWERFSRGSVMLLTWGGLRGGISIALALSLPESPDRQPVLMLTYVVVLFSVLVQGLSMPKLLQHRGS